MSPYTPPTKQKHLTQVDALRGVAISLVFLYHLYGSVCPQGFLGVDAFFVITGFFLLPPLLSINTPGHFGWLDYYRRKATRIMPPLLVMTLVVLLAAIPLMIADDLFSAAKTAQRVITGRVNVYLGKESVNYFAPSVKENLFLHTWYIAVLLQILIVAPLLCRPLAGLSASRRHIILILIALTSLLISFQHALPREWQAKLPSFFRDGGEIGSIYYMTFGRLWEIIAGAYVISLPQMKQRLSRTLLFCSGLLLLVIPCFLQQSASGFALFAVAGTVLIIRYGEKTYVSRIFENKVLIFLGTISYSLYLIHWPVMALCRYALMRDLELSDGIWLIPFSLLLSWTLYLGIEKRRFRLRFILILWGLAWLLCHVIQQTDGLENYVHADINGMKTYTSTDYQGWTFASADSWRGHYPKKLSAIVGHYGEEVLNPASQNYGHTPILQIGNHTREPNFILMGDSFANAIFPGFDIIAKKEGWSGLYLNLYVTPFWDRLNIEYSADAALFTREKAELLLQWLGHNSHLRYVIIHQMWRARFRPAETWDGEAIREEDVWEKGERGIRDFCLHLKNEGKTVIFIMPTPEANLPPKTQIMPLLKRSLLWYHPEGTTPHILTYREQYCRQNGRIRKILRKLQDDGLCRIIDPAPVLFKNDVFDPFDGDEIILYDPGHMTVYGATKLLEALKKPLQSLLQASSTDRENTENSSP